MRITYAICRGINKQQCEDSACIGDTVLNDAVGEMKLSVPAVVALCDGVGGNAGGRDASIYLCKKISEADELSPGKLQAINEELIAYGRQIGKPAMATTLTGVFFGTETITLMHAGNSRLYSIRGGFLNQITTDQTTYEWLNTLGNTEAAQTCNKSEIRCAFGGGKADYLKELVVKRIFEKALPQRLLFTTDGIHDYLSSDEMEEIMNEPITAKEKIRLLVDTAVRKGSPDDCSAILIENET